MSTIIFLWDTITPSYLKLGGGLLKSGYGEYYAPYFHMDIINYLCHTPNADLVDLCL